MRYAKPIWHSKTFWFNVLSGVAVVLAEVSTLLPDLGIETKWLLFAVALINIILRIMTTQPVQMSPADPPPLR